MIVTLFGETQGGSPPTPDDLMAWADQFGHEFPVLADPNFSVGGSFVAGSSIGLPSMSLIAPGGEVIKADQYVTEADIEPLLPW